MSILDQNFLTLDFWQDKVTYGKRALPTGSIGCAALNITDGCVRVLQGREKPVTDYSILAKNGAVLVSGLGSG